MVSLLPTLRSWMCLHTAWRVERCRYCCLCLGLRWLAGAHTDNLLRCMYCCCTQAVVNTLKANLDRLAAVPGTRFGLVCYHDKVYFFDIHVQHHAATHHHHHSSAHTTHTRCSTCCLASLHALSSRCVSWGMSTTPLGLSPSTAGCPQLRKLAFRSTPSSTLSSPSLLTHELLAPVWALRLVPR